MAKVKVVNEEPLEKQLWKAADKLRKNIDAAEYKHIVQGFEGFSFSMASMASSTKVPILGCLA